MRNKSEEEYLHLFEKIGSEGFSLCQNNLISAEALVKSLHYGGIRKYSISNLTEIFMNLR